MTVMQSPPQSPALDDAAVGIKIKDAASCEPCEGLLGQPGRRPIRVVIVGCGISGIMMAYRLQRDCENVTFALYDKNSDIGGTWYENRYPGAGCDIPAHAYSYPFALYPEWPRHNAYQEEIFEYLSKVVEVFDIRKFMKFNHEAVEARWVETRKKWHIEIEDQVGGNTIHEEADIFLPATGALNRRKWPCVKGLDLFKGRLMHSSAWQDDYREEKWKNDRVAVVGSGASAIQIVAAMQPKTKEIHNLVRSGKFFSAIADNFGIYEPYSNEARRTFRTEPDALVKHAKGIEAQMQMAVDMQIRDSPTARQANKFFTDRMKDAIKDERLLEGFLPRYGLGCKRVQPGDAYMRAVQEDNVHIHFAAATEFTENGVIDSNGEMIEVDTIVCATGFDTTNRFRFPIYGRKGAELGEMWQSDPFAYLGLSVPNMPNLFLFMGPYYPVHNGSIMGPLDANASYVIQAIHKMQRDGICALAPRADRTRQFVTHAQSWIQRTVWTDDCTSWFKTHETGRVTGLWPGSALHFVDAISVPRWEDYEIDYLDPADPFAWLGSGFTWAERTHAVDPTPFLSVRNLDPTWVKAMIGPREDEMGV